MRRKFYIGNFTVYYGTFSISDIYRFSDTLPEFWNLPVFRYFQLFWYLPVFRNLPGFSYMNYRAFMGKISNFCRFSPKLSVFAVLQIFYIYINIFYINHRQTWPAFYVFIFTYYFFLIRNARGLSLKWSHPYLVFRG